MLRRLGPGQERKEIWQVGYMKASEVQNKGKCYRQENKRKGVCKVVPEW